MSSSVKIMRKDFNLLASSSARFSVILAAIVVVYKPSHVDYSYHSSFRA